MVLLLEEWTVQVIVFLSASEMAKEMNKGKVLKG
jgi:hypothetical protein